MKPASALELEVREARTFAWIVKETRGFTWVIPRGVNKLILRTNQNHQLELKYDENTTDAEIAEWIDAQTKTLRLLMPTQARI